MDIQLKNNWKYKGNDWWEWEAFVDDGGSGEIKDIEFVEYVLHPTFPDPIRRIDSRNNNFKLQTEGWGEFKLKAFLHKKDGSKKKLEHNIELQYEPKQGTSS